MCGIVGIYNRDGAPVSLERVTTLRDTMVHRGPDDAGMWRREPEADVALGVRRLSIIDTSQRGHQPMANEDGSVMVAFNGEIYNQAELREGLKQKGHRFRSHCDTEVLVHLYEEDGPAMVDDLIGMFAFAIWDNANERLFIARDQLGIKPLYWFDDGSRFAFASEVRALLPLAPHRDVDTEALWQHLTFVAVPPPRTLFVGISKLGPAECIVVTRDGPGPVRRYWDPIAKRASFDGEVVDWERELRRRLEGAVQRQLMSDVPVGAFLSGGVDSSTNVALMSGMTDAPVNTFNIGYAGMDDFNEFQWAQQVVDRYHTKHHQLVVNAHEFWAAVPTVFNHLDEPTGSDVSVSVYLVSKLAREAGVRVVHFGEGSDEIFAGYGVYRRVERITRGSWGRFRRLPAPLRVLGAAAGSAILATRPNHDIMREAVRRAHQHDARLWWGHAIGFYELGIKRITTSRFRAMVGNRNFARELVLATAGEADAAGARDELDRIVYQDLRLRLSEQLLIRDDKLAMASSVEGRFPMLDRELVELAMSIPFGEKIRDNAGKHVLKRTVGDLLPHDLLWRPKQAFTTPMQHWLRDELAQPVARQLRGSAINDLGLIDGDAVQRLLALHQSKRANRASHIWTLLSLSMWFDHWIAGRDLQWD